MSSSNCCFLTCIQLSQEASHVVWYSHHFKYFPHFVIIHKDKGFGIVNKAEIDVSLELSCFVDNPTDIGNFTSDSSAFSVTSLIIWNFTVHVLLKRTRLLQSITYSMDMSLRNSGLIERHGSPVCCCTWNAK